MRTALVILSIATATVHAQIDPAILRPVGYHPSHIAYYNAPYFANALFQGGEWFSFTGSEFGTPVDFQTAQFENGYPRFLNAGQKLRAPVFGLNIENTHRPSAWPSRATLAKGRVVVTWKGNADVRLAGCTFDGGGATGNLADGRRAYNCLGANEATRSIEVHSIAWLGP